GSWRYGHPGRCCDLSHERQTQLRGSAHTPRHRQRRCMGSLRRSLLAHALFYSCTATRPRTNCRVVRATLFPRCRAVARSDSGGATSAPWSIFDCAAAPSQKPNLFRSASDPDVELFAGGKSRFTQCIPCWAAKSASCMSVESLSPDLAPELVKPAAILSFQR